MHYKNKSGQSPPICLHYHTNYPFGVLWETKWWALYPPLFLQCASLIQTQSTQFHMLMPFFKNPSSNIHLLKIKIQFFSLQLEEFHCKKRIVILTLTYFGYLTFMPHFCIIEHKGVPTAVSHSIE